MLLRSAVLSIGKAVILEEITVTSVRVIVLVKKEAEQYIRMGLRITFTTKCESIILEAVSSQLTSHSCLINGCKVNNGRG